MNRWLGQPQCTPGNVVVMGIEPKTTAASAPKTLLNFAGKTVAITGTSSGMGAAALRRCGDTAAVAPWLLLMGTHPLLGYAVDWGLEELPAGVLLMVLWLRRRAPGKTDGLLLGLLGLMRLELLFLPLLWWVLSGVRRRGPLAVQPDGSPFQLHRPDGVVQ